MTTTLPDMLKEMYHGRALVINVQLALPFFNLHQLVTIMNCCICYIFKATTSISADKLKEIYHGRALDLNV